MTSGAAISDVAPSAAVTPAFAKATARARRSRWPWKQIRRSGWIIIAVSTVWPAVHYALASFVLSRIDITNIDLHPAFTFNRDFIILGFLFLVFAAILTRGHQLEEEQKLNYLGGGGHSGYSCQPGLDVGQTQVIVDRAFGTSRNHTRQFVHSENQQS